MPVMDGFRFCEKAVLHYQDQNNIFKSSKEKNNMIQRPYLVACTANVNDEIRNQAIISGFDLVTLSPLNA